MSSPAAPPFRLVPLTEAHAREICGWRYPPPYDIYNWQPWELLVSRQEELGDPYIRETQFRAILDRDEQLCGFAQLFPIVGVTRLGLGMRPDLCGQGLGTSFVRAIAEYARKTNPGNEIDLEVLTWNERALRTYRQAGFVVTDTYVRGTPSGPGEFHCMVWEPAALHQEKDRLQLVLRTIAKLLNKNNVSWGLGGSAMLAYYGLLSAARDLDLLVSAEDAEKAHQLLASLGESRSLPPKEPFCTEHFYHYVIQDTEIDLMGLFGVRHAEGVYKLDWRQEQAERIVVEDGVPIPLTALEDWYVMYSLMPKREEKTTMIEQYWQANGMTRPDLLNKALQRELPESLRRKLRQLLA
jgi:[ribosomal protein S18]-alanine N-acetyltransferase